MSVFFRSTIAPVECGKRRRDFRAFGSVPEARVVPGDLGSELDSPPPQPAARPAKAAEAAAQAVKINASLSFMTRNATSATQTFASGKPLDRAPFVPLGIASSAALVRNL